MADQETTSSPSVLTGYDVRIIANPMAGKDEPVFGALSQAFADAGVRWNLDVTNEPGEEGALARRAVEDGAAVVVAFGGDGTVSAVADSLVGTDVLLGILPGGTANVFAKELGIPLDLEAAAKLIVGPHEVRKVDLGTAELADGQSRTFILRVAAGLEATMVEDSAREDKERLGMLAYALTALKQLPQTTPAVYRIESGDGSEAIEEAGLFAVVTNARYLGIGDAAYPDDVKVDDGILDGIIAPAAMTELAGAAAAAVQGKETPLITRTRGTELVLSAQPPQRVAIDGEVLGDTPVRVRVRPSAVSVIAPPQTTQEDTEGTNRA